MKYKIEKISIDKESAEKLIDRMATEIRDANEDILEKKGIAFYIASDDKKIDIWFKVQFHSEFELQSDETQSGLTCINRSVKVDLTFTESETGEEIKVKAPYSLEEELQKRFKI